MAVRNAPTDGAIPPTNIVWTFMIKHLILQILMFWSSESEMFKPCQEYAANFCCDMHHGANAVGVDPKSG